MNYSMKKRLVLFLAIGLGFTACSGGTASSGARRKGTVEAQNSGTPESLSAAGVGAFRKRPGHAHVIWPSPSTPTRVQFPGCLILSDQSSPSRVRSAAPTARP